MVLHQFKVTLRTTRAALALQVQRDQRAEVHISVLRCSICYSICVQLDRLLACCVSVAWHLCIFSAKLRCSAKLAFTAKLLIQHPKFSAKLRIQRQTLNAAPNSEFSGKIQKQTWNLKVIGRTYESHISPKGMKLDLTRTSDQLMSSLYYKWRMDLYASPPILVHTVHIVHIVHVVRSIHSVHLVHTAHIVHTVHTVHTVPFRVWQQAIGNR